MQIFQVIFFVALLVSLKSFEQPPKDKGVLILVSDSATGTYGYKNEAGKIVIPMGKYAACFTDSFRNYAAIIDFRHNYPRSKYRYINVLLFSICNSASLALSSSQYAV